MLGFPNGERVSVETSRRDEHVHFADMTAYAYSLPRPIPQVLNIGWLDAEHPFATGTVGAGIVATLRALADRGESDEGHASVRAMRRDSLAERSQALERLALQRYGCPVATIDTSRRPI
jgi:hypothetical protein